MKRFDKFEQDMLKAYEGGILKSISPTKADLTKFKAAASATFIKERRVNIRLSSPDLMDIQARPWRKGCRIRLSSQAFCTSTSPGALLRSLHG